jgi:hypothetical protein
MSIKCTYGDVVRLRDVPGPEGVVRGVAAKLYDLLGAEHEQVSVVDRFRLMRFVQAVDKELREYGRVLSELGRKYGEPSTEGGSAVFRIRPERKAEFDAEKASLDAEERELPVNPLPVSAYERVPLTPRELACLEKFVVPPPE